MSGPVGAAGLRSAWLDDEPLPVDVSAAGWRLQVRRDSLSGIRFDDAPVLRALRFVVRDRDWGTVPADLELLGVEHAGDGTQVLLRARAHEDDVDVAWTGHLVLRAGSLSLTCEATARSSFQRNRIGIVLLHSPDLAGQPLTVRRADGSTTATTFPVDVSPHQPARDIAGLAWSSGPVRVSAALEGDVFEMEDQRNWTDASFKTYSTPLALPFPVRVRAGEVLRQSVVLTCRATERRTGPRTGLQSGPPAAAGPAAPAVALVAAGHRLPEVTVGASTAPAGPGPRSLPWVAGLTQLVELDLRSGNWPDALARARADAGGAPLDVRLVTDDPAALPPALDALSGVPLVRLAAFDASSHVGEPHLFTALEGAARSRGLDAELVAGTRAHFTELNRTCERLPPAAPALAFSLTPQMHDTGRDQVVESVAVQRLVAEQAVRLGAGRPVHVGPVTLRPRFNAVATTPQPPDPATTVAAGYGAEHVRAATDPRQRSRAAAAWLVASAAALSVPGVASTCFAEAWGPRGFGEADGRAFPAADALVWLAQLAGWERLDAAGPLPAGVSVLAARRHGATVLLASNLADARQHVRIHLGAQHPDGVLQRTRAGAGEELPDALALPAGEDGLDLLLDPGTAVRWSSGDTPGR